MNQIVIDTCTLKHSADPKCKYFLESIEFINKLQNNTVDCIVDEGFSLIETDNTSYIGFEYIKHLQPGTLGFELIKYLALNERIQFVSNNVPNNTKKYIERIIRNKKDRIFLRVTYNSVDKILASHDFTDYQARKRKFIKRELNILIATAGEITKWF